MSLALVVQALGWLSVVGLVVVHLLIQRGELPADGLGYRVAGCLAAGSVVVAAAIAELWPVAVLGLLWLRIGVFGHPVDAGPPVRPPQLASAELQPHAQLPHAQLPHAHLPHPHLPHPRPRTVNRIFKAEMTVVILIALVLFGVWSQQQHAKFERKTNRIVCSWIDGC
jgi:hypothetical protein